jgi:hypothetical protein
LVDQLQRALPVVEPAFRERQLKNLDVNLELDKAQLEHEGQESVAAIQLEMAKLQYEEARSRTEAEHG